MIIQQSKECIYEIDPLEMEEGYYYLGIDEDQNYHVVIKENESIVIIGDGFGLIYRIKEFAELGIRLVNEIQITKIEYKVKA